MHSHYTFLKPEAEKLKLSPFGAVLVLGSFENGLTVDVKGDTELLCVRVAKQKLEQRVIFTAVFEVKE